MAFIRWRLADFLEERGLSVYALAKATGTPRMNTIYRLARRGQEPTRVDLPTLAAVIAGLRRLTGQAVAITEILEFVADDEQAGGEGLNDPPGAE